MPEHFPSPGVSRFPEFYISGSVRIYPFAKTVAEAQSNGETCYVHVTPQKFVTLKCEPRYLSPEMWQYLTLAVQRAFFLAYRDDLADAVKARIEAAGYLTPEEIAEIATVRTESEETG